jgi:mannose-6-phosphate isomerase-like protein (cupin superfamily)
MRRTKSYPYTIDNGQGESLTFLGIAQGPDGLRIEAEGGAAPGGGPPMHVHHLQAEGVRVLEGKVGYQVLGEEPKFAGPGEEILWPAGTAHKWWNAGTGAARLTGWCSPPDNFEFYIATLFASAKANGGWPSLFDGAFLMTRYRSEFEMVELPLVVRRVVLPIVYMLGKVLGKYRKFAGAPAPIAR